MSRLLSRHDDAWPLVSWNRRRAGVCCRSALVTTKPPELDHSTGQITRPGSVVPLIRNVTGVRPAIHGGPSSPAVDPDGRTTATLWGGGVGRDDRYLLGRTIASLRQYWKQHARRMSGRDRRGGLPSHYLSRNALSAQRRWLSSTPVVSHDLYGSRRGPACKSPPSRQSPSSLRSVWHGRCSLRTIAIAKSIGAMRHVRGRSPQSPAECSQKRRRRRWPTWQARQRGENGVGDEKRRASTMSGGL